MQSKNEKSKLTCFEMQKTSISSLSRPEGPGKPQELCVLLLVQGPLERNHLLSKDTGRFHPPNSLPKPEAERMSPRGSWAAGSAVAVHFKGTLHYASLRILKQRKELKKKKLLCVVSQNGSQPFLNLSHRHVLPQSIILNLILGNFPH